MTAISKALDAEAGDRRSFTLEQLLTLAGCTSDIDRGQVVPTDPEELERYVGPPARVLKPDEPSLEELLLVACVPSAPRPPLAAEVAPPRTDFTRHSRLTLN
jgi:hypothetical protein